MRLLLVFTIGLVDTALTVALTGHIGLGAVVALAGGWATAQHDHLYQRVRARA